jgi:KaiC/GvpD/RAD55 family RecA-like ATPase
MIKKRYFKPIDEAVEDVRREGPIPFIWGGIKEGSFGYVFGPSKSGKTTLSENLAMMLVCGAKEFLGYPLPGRPYRVLFISLEEYKRPRCERNDKQLQYLHPLPELIKNLFVIEDDFPKFIKDDTSWEMISETISESGAEVVFIDSLTRMGAGEIERSDIARAVSAKLKEIAHECGVTMIIIHHTPKLNGQMISIDSLAGSHVFAQEADFLIGVNKVTSKYKHRGVRYLKEVASRYRREDDENVLVFEINEHMWLEEKVVISEAKLFEGPDGRVDETKYNLVSSIIMEQVKGSGTPDFRDRDIRNKAEKEMNRSTYYEKINDLVISGVITRTGKGEYKFNSLPSVT